MNHIAPHSRKPAGSIFARPARGPRFKARANRIEELKKRKFDSTRLLHCEGWILVGPRDVVPLAPLDAVLLLTVAGHRLATEEILMEALWPDPDDMPDYWADQIKVRVCALRKSLKQVGAAEEIVNEWGRGFYLRRANK